MNKVLTIIETESKRHWLNVAKRVLKVNSNPQFPLLEHSEHISYGYKRMREIDHHSEGA